MTPHRRWSVRCLKWPHRTAPLATLDINLKKCNFQKPWKIHYNPNVIIFQSKELTKKEHDMMTKNRYKTNNMSNLIFYTNGFKTENEAAAVIFILNSNHYQYYKHQMTYQNITCFDNEKIMGKNWNLDKITSNNIEELYVIWKTLIWTLKIFQNTKKMLD